MAAYVIVDIEIHDAKRYEEYKKLAATTVTAYGGRYIVRGGTAEQLEGEWVPGRVVVLEFPSVDRARQWWDSAEYAPAKALRQASASTRMIVVQGV
ncbi:MAG: D-fructose-6-phosphate amidotransferase [Gemmatimonas sp. SG8_17]|nr:MAG: D-fructose-6-phosphate amidotransferase [Gemmatimonas sp. SG8_17]